MSTGSPHDHEEPRRVLIADDDEGTRILLAEALSNEAGVDLVASAKDADEAIALVDEVEPDVAIIDASMRAAADVVAVEEIRTRHPDLGLIALTAMDPVIASSALMSPGAVCFLQKSCSAEGLIAAIRMATAGRAGS